ncbi:CRISPR-associated endonuclease Cas3'' [Zoogloea sp. LCSB751]|uniref:CRISPR-associated endonuclease Cas3'' n=1 Tax=Zoogloea sp. LCSB751 TaxID=1965277 RepID=UPI0009A53CA5|nr:CRISPR-associated endonuclease Cas3'' [Zoogloea sp. LCSB751]
MKFPDDIFLAHTAESSDGSPRAHALAEHMRCVSEKAAASAMPFGAADWASLAGLWHDLGKYRPGFQRYIRDCADAHIEGRVPSKDKTHSAAGALHAIEHLKSRLGPRGEMAATVLAYLIAGHHAGLADWHGGLKGRLASDDARREYADALAAAPTAILENTTALELKDAVPGGLLTPGAFALWLRMLFSTLVDADFLDTESFMDTGKADARGDFPPLAEMHNAYNTHMASFAADTPVRRIRADILRQCRSKAKTAPGLYTLTVPTGGGKTLASLGFALDHALVHDKRRIIYAIPYTSIIEQTADVFRDVFAPLGRECVVEHHSQAESDPADETGASRLACENWDAPLVVTTNVQLFESLFAARTSRCRKLHRLVGSVLILDEAQQLPPEFLQPILDVLRLLIRHYGVTVVLCTATQPALSTTDYFDPSMNLRGLDDATELMDDPDALYAALKRVDVRLPTDFNAPTEWPALADELTDHDSVLAIVNTRGGARELHRRMPKGTLHLSALMCGAHRKDVIDHIKARLSARRQGDDTAPLRVVSTQLVEAGVDLDFPVVYRALAGLDSIAQAAGRCNREGALPEQGKVFVFVPPGKIPAGSLSQGAQACRGVLHGKVENPLDRKLFEAYFRQFYATVNLDQHGIVDLLKLAPTREDPLAVAFRSAADKFELIPDNQAPVVVLYRGPDGKDEKVDILLGALKKDGPERWLMRALQRYTVSLPQQQAESLLAQGDLSLVMPGLYVQANDLLYDPQLGLRADDQPLSASGLVC